MSEQKQTPTIDFSLDVAGGLQGAYVQHPSPIITSLFINQSPTIIIDFASLYPTVQSLVNLDYNSIKHRYFQIGSIDTFINVLKNYNGKKQELIVEMFINKLVGDTKRFLDKDADGEKKASSKKAKRLQFIKDVYVKRFRRVLKVIQLYGFDELMKPTLDMPYHVFVNDFMTILELIHKIKIDGFHETAINLGTRFDEFLTEDYSASDDVYIIKDVHDRNRSLVKMKADEFKEFSTGFITNPYGVLSLKHNEYMSPTIERILDGLMRRGVVKNFGKVSGSVATKMSDDNIKTFKSLDELKEFMKSLDSYAQHLSKKLDDDFFNQMLNVDNNALTDLGSDAISLSDVMKVFNNSGYGIGGVKTNPYSSIFLSNSITMTAKVYGILLLQYIVDNEFYNLNQVLEALNE